MALRKKGVLSVEGEGSARLISDYRQLRQAQTALTRELGLSPLSRQAIRAAGGDVTDITEAAAARIDKLAPQGDSVPSGATFDGEE